MKFQKIQQLAAVFEPMEAEYNTFSRHFDGISVGESELPGIPADIAKVIKGVLGAQGSQWIYKKVPAFDNQRVVDIIKTEAGRKAVKLILFRMPI